MFNFIIDCSDSALDFYKNISKEQEPLVFTRGDLNWCLQTYLLLLKKSKFPVSCSNKLHKNAVNIVHSDHLLHLKAGPSYFIVCIRADYPARRWAHFHIVQNMNQIKSNTSYIPHWVQPGIIKRDLDRSSVAKVAYAGEVMNGNFAGTIETWENLLRKHNIEFVALQAGSWHNLSDVDVLIGVRSFNEKPHDTKPPTKLFNAWHANIPFIGGYDSAFKQVGNPNKDYILVKSTNEVIDALIKLKSDPRFYRSIVQNGNTKAIQFSEQAIIKSWEKVLSVDISRRYAQWKSRLGFEKIRYTIFNFLGILEHRSKRTVKMVLKTIVSKH